ncbi:type IV pilin-like G/H family protein [Limnospira fusiformis]|uniref:type IV pilin-like G/H family protein n=1 Tax=Limnospira fusiformis TaxID=54297 RepID=UPI002AA21557|nr:type IV pilin-like G/H family protein [Limnospira fusiformis LS22]
MKTELKAKFLQHISQKKRDGGFTLIELLVVIIIIGILSAIALPSFLNQANKARQSEARTYVGSINRAQQARFMEAGAFTSELPQLGLGIQSQTDNYTYTLTVTATGANPQGAMAAASGLDTLRNYVGLAFTGSTAQGEATTFAILCEADNATQPIAGTAGDTVCPGSFTAL